MASPVDIRPDHLKIVQDILREYLPVDVRVWVFGSRAIWTTKDSSDLDLALESEGRLSNKLLGVLKDAFEDSALPYTVDIVDLNRISESFRDIVMSQRAPLFIEGEWRIDIRASHRKTILALLEKYLPNTTVWVYGSRVKWTSRPQSDLDMVVFSAPEQHLKVSDLREAFEESNLPFRVELFVWDEVPEQFWKPIEADHLVLVEGKERSLECEWSVASVGDFFDLVTGYAFKSRDFCEDGIPVIKIKNVKAGHFSKHQFSYVSPNFLDTRSEKIALADDLLISMSGNRHDGSPETWVGKVALFREEDTYFINQRVGALRLKPNTKLNRRFASFLLSSRPYQELFISIATSSGGQANLSPQQILGAPIRYPEISEQRAIAHILGTLDEKIELNRRMNETLEAMARALFKSWFVDFDPVRAKIALKHRKSITPPPQAHHSPLEGESASQGRQPAGETVGGQQGKGASPQASRWGEIKRLYSPQNLKRAKALRQSQSNAEGLLWHYLRKKQLDGHKFRRQQPIGRYIVDFVCMPKKLVIELDGGQHSTQKAYDEQRDQFLTERGYRVLRFWNSVVFENCYGVLESILAALQDDATKVSESPPSPSPNHSSLEGESARQGPQPAGEPVGGRQSKGTNPKLSRNPVSTPLPGGSDWTVERAKAYLERMPPDVVDLFPDQLVDSELGEIPEGWEVKSLGKAAKLNPPEPMKRGTLAPYLNMAALPTSASSPDKAVLREFKSGTRFRNGDTLLARITPCLENGKTAFVQSLPKDTVGWGSTEFIVLRAVPPVPPEYTYLLARDAAFREHAIQSMTGTSGRQRVQVNALAPYLLPFPPSDVWVKFRSLISPMFAKIEITRIESRSLATQRDALLPKLVSGIVRVQPD